MKQLVMAVVMVMCFASVVFAGTHSLGEHVSTAVELTGSGTFLDLGAEIDTGGTKTLGILIDLTHTGNEYVSVKALGKFDDDTLAEFDIPMIGYPRDLTFSHVNDYVYDLSCSGGAMNHRTVLKWQLDEVVPIVQIQAAAYFDSSTSNDATVSSMIVIENR